MGNSDHPLHAFDAQQRNDALGEGTEPPTVAKLERPRLGEWCEVHAEACGCVSHYRKTWMATRCTPFNAMYIGYRTVQNGHVNLEQWSDGDFKSFSPTEYLEVWLFVVDARTNPIRAFPTDVKRADAGSEAGE